jgi:hypothetical protein
MLDKTKAIEKLKQNNTTVYVFNCKWPDCTRLIKVHSGKFKVHSGKCKLHTKLHPHKAAYNRLVYTASLRELSCTITFKDYVGFVGADCHFCGDELEWEPQSKRHHMDRYDNLKGYTLDNCVPCCSQCNKTKGTLNGDLFIERCKEIANYHA